MDIAAIWTRIRAGNYLTRSHAVQHALKEGFERRHIIEAVIQGKIIEEYGNEQRVLVCGKTTLADGTSTYLHVVCEYTDPLYVEFVTAYIPEQGQWENPPFRRRKRARR